MMLFKDNKVYVNKSDLRFMLHNYKLLDIPDEIFDGLLYLSSDHRTVKQDNRSNSSDSFSMNFSNETDNDWIGFEDKKCIDYFESAPYMINYDEYINMSDEQIDEEINNVCDHMINLQDYYACLSDARKDLAVTNYNANMEMLGHEYTDILTMINIRNNFVKLELPNEYTPIAIIPITDVGLVGPVKVAKKDMKHVYFAEKYIFNFNVQDIYRYTNIK